MSPWLRYTFRKVHRISHRKNMRHMEKVWPQLKMEETQNGARRVFWRGKFVVETRPLTETKTWPHPSSKALMITTGPSIENEDLSNLGNSFVVGVNGAIAIQDKYSVKFDAYFIIDASFIKNRPSLFERVLNSNIPCFLSYNCLGQICDTDPNLLKNKEIYLLEAVNKRFNRPALAPDKFYAWAQSQKYFITSPDFSPNNEKVGFSFNPEIGVYDGATVAFWALQVLLYAGFSSIGILGMDLGNTESAVRFYEAKEDGLRSKLEKNYQSTIEPSFKLAAIAFEKRGCEVYNLSPVSRLSQDIIRKVSLADFINK